MNQQRTSHWPTFLMGVAVVVFTIALVVYPKQGFDAGISGLKMFWDIVFPSLLPFFILAELMLGLGIVRGLGVFLEPLMRPLFSVPGIGAFALSMGLAAGYPMDAVITARFRETGLCSRIEGERLLAFTNTADPLFMITAVAVGMLKSPGLGALIAVAHYISAFLVGVSFKFWGRGGDNQRLANERAPLNGRLFVRAVQEIIKAREEDGRAFGKLMRDSVTESFMTLLMICGFIVFFAVMIEILNVSGMLAILGLPVTFVYHILGVHGDLVNPTLAGLLEIDIGTAQTAAVNAAPLIQKLAVVSAIIAWSGLAVHAQVASVIGNTDIRMTPYFLARFLHAVLAAGITVLLYALGIGKNTTTVFANNIPAFAAFQDASTGGSWYHVMWTGMSTWVCFILVLVALSLMIYLLRRVRVIVWHTRMNRM